MVLSEVIYEDGEVDGVVKGVPALAAFAQAVVECASVVHRDDPRVPGILDANLGTSLTDVRLFAVTHQAVDDEYERTIEVLFVAEGIVAGSRILVPIQKNGVIVRCEEALRRAK